MNSKKGLFIFALSAVIVGTLGYMFRAPISGALQSQKPLVGVFLPDLTTAPRWGIEAGYFREMLEADGFQVELHDATGNGATQAYQIRDFVDRGGKGIIVVPADANTLGPVLIDAHARGVKIVSYDRLARRSPVDRYATIDMSESGRLEYEALATAHPGAKFLYLGGEPSDVNSELHRNGVLGAAGVAARAVPPVVADVFMTPGWDSALAYEHVSAKIASSTDFSAVIAANDQLASAAISAAARLRKKLVFVAGSDGDLDACARIRAGVQTVTIMKPIQNLAQEAVLALQTLMKGAEPRADKMTDNGYAAIKTIFIAPIKIDRSNITRDISKCAPL